MGRSSERRYAKRPLCQKALRLATGGCLNFRKVRRNTANRGLRGLIRHVHQKFKICSQTEIRMESMIEFPYALIYHRYVLVLQLEKACPLD